MENINYVAHLKGLHLQMIWDTYWDFHSRNLPVTHPVNQLLLGSEAVSGRELRNSHRGRRSWAGWIWILEDAARPPGVLFPMRQSGIWPWCSFSFGNKCISGVLGSVTGMQRAKPGYCSYPCFISVRKVNEASKSGHRLLTQLGKMGRTQQLGGSLDQTQEQMWEAWQYQVGAVTGHQLWSRRCEKVTHAVTSSRVIECLYVIVSKKIEMDVSVHLEFCYVFCCSSWPEYL